MASPTPIGPFLLIILTSNFSAYQVVFNFQSQGVMREKLIYLDPEHRDRITDYTNKGKQYF